jgi:hypothetical protein
MGPAVPNYLDVIGASGPALEVCLLWRLCREDMRGRYRFLFAYLAFSLLAMELTLFVVRHAIPAAYALLYWHFEVVSLFFRFFVVWEIYRHTFPPGSLRRRIPLKVFGAVCFWAALFSLSALSWYQAYNYFDSRYLALECSLDFAQAVLVLAQLVVAKHYGFLMGRNVWGLAVGFGAYVSINILHFSVYDLYHSIFAYYQAAVPTSFVGMMAIWTWALWTYAPNPHTDAVPRREPSKETLWWTERWERTLSAVRKVVNL